MSKGERKENQQLLGALCVNGHRASQGCGHVPRELVRGARSQNLPPGQALSFDAWYPTSSLFKVLHISAVWLIFPANCSRRTQQRRGGAGGLAAEPPLAPSPPGARLLGQS